MNWQVSYNANPTLIANTLASTPHKTLRKNSKMTLQLNGILASVLEAKGAGSTLAETSLKQYSLNPKHTTFICAMVKHLWGYTAKQIGTECYSTYSKHFDGPETRVRAKLQITWPGNNMPKCDFAVFQPMREHFVDITLVCDGVKFGAHRVILATRSDYLKTMLTGTWKECQTLEIPVHASKEAFSAFLDFLYGEPCKLSEKSIDFVGSILELAQFFLVQDIKESCLSELALRISPDTLKQITEIATKLNFQELFNICSWKSTEEFISSPRPYIENFKIAGQPMEELAKILQVNKYIQNPRVQQECIAELQKLQTGETDAQITNLAKQYGLISLLPASNSC